MIKRDNHLLQDGWQGYYSVDGKGKIWQEFPEEVNTMKIEYDPVRDLLYICLDVPGKKVAETVTIAPGVHVDFSAEKKTGRYRSHRCLRGIGKEVRVWYGAIAPAIYSPRFAMIEGIF